MKPIIVLLAIVCQLFAAHSAALAQTESPPPIEAPVMELPEFKVRVEVVFDMPEPISEPFSNCVLNDLQSLDGVEVTDNNPQYRITIMALPNRTEQETMGFTFSIFVTRPFDRNLLKPLLMSKNISDNEKMLLLLLGREYVRVEKSSLLTTSPGEVGLICKNIVSGFEADLLAKDRLLWKSMLRLRGQPGQMQDQSAPIIDKGDQ